MHKVIVERPRILRGGWTNRKTSLHLSSSQCAAAAEAPEDYDSGARRASSGRHGKWFNENLAPLRRYLLKQVGRPWDKVYGEICQTIDTRSTVGLHVLQHLSGYVTTDAFLQDGVVCEHSLGGVVPVKGLYVHPVTRLLRCTKNSRRRKRRHLSPDKEDLNFVSAGDTLAYQKIDGLWFRTEYRRLGLDEFVDRGDGVQIRVAALGCGAHLTFVRKQQCDRKTIQRIERGELGCLEARPRANLRA